MPVEPARAGVSDGLGCTVLLLLLGTLAVVTGAGAVLAATAMLTAMPTGA